jgi:hypothetical protein
MFEQFKVPWTERVHSFWTRSQYIRPNHLFACWRECSDYLLRQFLI